MGLMTSIVSMERLSSNPLLISLEQPLSVHRSQPVVSCPLPFYRLQLSPQVSQPLSRRILAQSNSSGSKRRYHCQPSFLGLVCLGCCSSILHKSVFNQLYFRLDKSWSHCKCQSLSPDQLLLLSLFWRVSSSWEMPYREWVKINPTHIQFYWIVWKNFLRSVDYSSHRLHGGHSLRTPYLIPMTLQLIIIYRKIRYQLLTE